MMKYRVKVAQIRTTEIEGDAPHYDIAQLRATEQLKDAEWNVWKMTTERVEKEPFEESLEQRHERQRQIEAVRQQQKMFGEPTTGNLLKETL
jgi:hypothetical protein